MPGGAPCSAPCDVFRWRSTRIEDGAPIVSSGRGSSSERCVGRCVRYGLPSCSRYICGDAPCKVSDLIACLWSLRCRGYFELLSHVWLNAWVGKSIAVSEEMDSRRTLNAQSILEMLFYHLCAMAIAMKAVRQSLEVDASWKPRPPRGIRNIPSALGITCRCQAASPATATPGGSHVCKQSEPLTRSPVLRRLRKTLEQDLVPSSHTARRCAAPQSSVHHKQGAQVRRLSDRSRECCRAWS
jgi:hypothetical protein